MDGLLFAPSHYHVAAQARGLLRFLDPEDEAFFVALGEVTKPLPLHEATRLVADGRIIDDTTQEPLEWPAKRMFLPVSERMKKAYEGRDYERSVKAAVAHQHLRLARSR